MDENIIKLALACVVGIAGVYGSYVISPYLAKGLNVVSEQIIDKSLPIESTTEYIFEGLTFFVILSTISIIFNYDLSSLCMSIIDPLCQNVDNIYDISKLQLENELLNLERMGIVTNALDINWEEGYVSNICAALICKATSSSLILDSRFFDYYDEEHLKRLEYFAAIPNETLMKLAPLVREYYLFKQIWGSSIDCTRILQQAGTTSDAGMMLTLMESLHRGGSGFGGVSTYELILRDLAVQKVYNTYGFDLFNASLKYIDNSWTIDRNVYYHWFIDGSAMTPRGYIVNGEYYYDGIDYKDIVKVYEWGKLSTWDEVS